MTRELQIKVDRARQALAHVFADTSGEPEANIAAFTVLKEECSAYIGALEEMKKLE